MRDKTLIFLLSIIALLTFTGCNDSQETVIADEVEVNESNNDHDELSDDNAVENESDNDTDNVETGIESAANENEEENEVNTEENPRDGPEAVEIDDLELLKVHFIDVGQADATLFEFSYQGEDFKILFDTGNWNRSDVINYLNSLGVQSIDIVVGSHPHADHIGQLDRVVTEFDVGEVWMSGDTNTSQNYQNVMDAIESSGVEYHEPRAGEIYDVGPLEVTVLNPASVNGNLNEGSVALLFKYGETSFILTGDVEAQNEQSILSRGFDLDADVLQLGHHGSNTSTTEPFLNAVSPSIAIVSAGENNQYGHPHDEVIARVTNAGAEIYATYKHGTIIIESDGQSLNVLTKEDGTVSPASSSQQNSSSEPATSEPIESEEQEEDQPTPTASEDGSCIDINSASLSELEGIKHIGPERAEALVDLRPFSSVDDLTRVSGIAAG
ncbi:MBL fold metallo-hydrolase [Alkalihalophilus lindianensis]|uniref:MBL fold metallo-hydrolase n=1 Tax=Alkalihalophilus lindianensis TaxID=1630542 RepID=A0ABU3XBB5_9BACI|nr:MBL fold metallo-hydrolase [Alkalihalophilus lindianensis]MDV2685182.1 MBL fold metallo-hydrolase [Alkalihalophilus lindianensis]